MIAHVRINLLLVGLTLLICAVLYPLGLLGVSQVAFHEQAEGSIVRHEGQAVGSSLVAQEFKGDQWFQPRPSAASWKGDASQGSNWAANNPLLRDRAARQLGPMVKYADGPKKGQSVGDDIEAWFPQKKDRVGEWAQTYPRLASNWVKSDENIEQFVKKWVETHPDIVVAWKKDNPDQDYDADKPEDAAVQFFVSFAHESPAAWPAVVERKIDGKSVKKVEAIRTGDSDKDRSKAFAAVQGIFFDAWLQDNPEQARHLEKAPADQVTASASGLDPDITLHNSHSQLERVVEEWSKSKKDARQVRAEVEAALKANAYRPLGGLVGGEELVNVLKLNMDMEQRLRTVPAQPR